jgi:subtilisin family serine protease
MRFFLLIFLCTILTPPVFAGVILQKSVDLPDHYLLKFSLSDNVAARLKQPETPALGKSAAIGELRDQQAHRTGLLVNDMRDTDLKIMRDLWIRQSLAISISAKYLARLRALSYVEEVRVDPQYKAQAQNVVTLPLSGELVQDNLERVDIDSLWADGYRGQGVVVAIMDSGIDPEHDDLIDRWRGGTNSWFDPYQEQSIPKDLTGHGTAVASLVLGGDAASSYLGVAPNAQWIAARIFDNVGGSSESAISEALQWMLDPDGNAATDDYPDIVQNSWGLAGTEGSCFNPFAAELAAIDAFGIDIVFAAGNSGLSGPGAGGFSSYLVPAGDSHAISVGALQGDPFDTLLFASSRGPDRCGSAVIPSLVAPGFNLRTADLTFGGFDTDATTVNTGTSFSSPHMSGALALLRSKFQAAGYLEYRAAIFESAFDLGPLGDDRDYGRGILQVSAAATVLENQATPLRANEVSFSNAVYVFSESDANARISVIRTGDISVTASVDINSVDGSANSIDDFVAVMATLDFAAGESVKHVDLQLTDDAVEEKNESFTLALSLVDINLGSKTVMVVTIKDHNGDAAGEEEDEAGGGSSGLLTLLLVGLLYIGRRFKR